MFLLVPSTRENMIMRRYDVKIIKINLKPQINQYQANQAPNFNSNWFVP